MKKILIVDDERVHIETISRGLKIRGFKVCNARSGKDALKQLSKQSKIDMVITDYLMPGMNGAELIEKIKQTHTDLPVIMMTAHNDKEFIIESVQQLCDGIIDKTFSLDELLNEINRYLKP